MTADEIYSVFTQNKKNLVSDWYYNQLQGLQKVIKVGPEGLEPPASGL